MDAVITVFGVAVVSGVFAFATIIVNKLFEQVKFYQEKLLPAVEDNTATVRELKSAMENRGKDAS